MQKISKMAFACGLVLVLIIGSVEMYLMSPLPMPQQSRFGNAFSAAHGHPRFTRQPQYFLNQPDPADMLLFQQSQQAPRLYGMESLFNMQQQPIYQHQAPPQPLSPRYAPTPKTQGPRPSESAGNLYRPLHMNIDPQTSQPQSSSNRDFLSTIEIIDNQGRPSNLKDLGIGNVDGQMYNPELAEQLMSIFEKINLDLMNADFVPLDVEGANQQIGHMFQNQYNQQQDSPAEFQSNPAAQQIQQKPIEYKTTIPAKQTLSTTNYTTPVEQQPETKRYQYLKPVRSYRANAQHPEQAPQQALNVGHLPIANELPKQYGIQSSPQLQLLKPAHEKHQRQQYSKPSQPLTSSNHEQTVNNQFPTTINYQVPQTSVQPLRITQRPPIFDNAPIVQKDVANDAIGFNNDPAPILPPTESGISSEKPMVPQVVSFDSRINLPAQPNPNRVANEKPLIPLSQPTNFQARPDIWIPMSMHPLQQQQQQQQQKRLQNFFRYDSAAPLNQPAIVQQKEQFDHDERLNVPQMVTQEQESFLSENQNEQLERKQPSIVSQTNILNEPTIQNNKEFGQQKEQPQQQQQQESFESQVENQEEQQKLFDGSFGDSSTAKPLVGLQFEDSRQSKPRQPISTSLINSFNSQRSEQSDQVNSQKSAGDLNLQAFNQQKIDQFTTQQQKERPFLEEPQQQEVISQRKELNISTQRSNAQQTAELQQQQEDLEPVVTTSIPTTTTTTTTTTAAPTTTTTTLSTTTTTTSASTPTIRKSTNGRVEQSKTRKVRIQSKNRSPVQIQKNTQLRQQQQTAEARRSNQQQLAKQTAVPQGVDLIGQKVTQSAQATERPVPRLATRRFIVKSPRSKRPPPAAVVKQQQQLSQEQFPDNKSSQQTTEQTSSELPKAIQDEIRSNVKLFSTQKQSSSSAQQQQNSNEDVAGQEKSSFKQQQQQQQKEESVSLREESTPSFTEQTKMDVSSQPDDEFQSQEKFAADVAQTTSPRDMVAQQKDPLLNQKEEQKKDTVAPAAQAEVLPVSEQQDEISQEKDTLSPAQEPLQAVTQQQQQQTQEDAREQQKEITTTEVALSQEQQFVTSAQLEADKSQTTTTEQKQDQDLDSPTNKPQSQSQSQPQTESVQAQQQQILADSSPQTNEGFQPDEEVSTGRPAARFFSRDEQKELAQEKDTAASGEDTNESAEQKNSENLTAKLARTGNAQLAATRKRAHISSNGARRLHHELSSHQLTDTYNPLQFEPERIVSTKSADSSLQNRHVNLSESY